MEPDAIHPPLNPSLGSPPRRIALLNAAERPRRMPPIVLLIFIGIAAFLAMSVVSQLALLLLGHTVSATVTARDPLPAEKNEQRYKISYTYDIGRRHGEETVEEPDPDGLMKVGSRVDVRALVIGPRRSVLASQFSARSLWCLTPFAVVFDGIAAAIILGAWVLPWRAKNLILLGATTEGTIVSVEARTDSQSPQWDVVYEYSAKGRTAKRSEIWTEALAGRLKAGDKVTVIYWPRKLRRAMVYGTGDFRVVDERGLAVPI